MLSIHVPAKTLNQGKKLECEHSVIEIPKENKIANFVRLDTERLLNTVSPADVEITKLSFNHEIGLPNLNHLVKTKEIT